MDRGKKYSSTFGYKTLKYQSMLRSNAESLTQHSQKWWKEKKERAEKEYISSNWNICKVPRKYFRWVLQHLHLNISRIQLIRIGVDLDSHTTDYIFSFSFHYFNLSWFKHRSGKIFGNTYFQVNLSRSAAILLTNMFLIKYIHCDIVWF